MTQKELKTVVRGVSLILAAPWLWAWFSPYMESMDFKFALGMTCWILVMVGVFVTLSVPMKDLK